MGITALQGPVAVRPATRELVGPGQAPSDECSSSHGDMGQPLTGAHAGKAGRKGATPGGKAEHPDADQTAAKPGGRRQRLPRTISGPLRGEGLRACPGGRDNGTGGASGPAATLGISKQRGLGKGGL